MATINITDIVTNDLDGNGSFDKLMNAVEIRLETQYREGKIKGTDYANVYLGSMQAVLQQAIAYILGVQQADKQADLIAEQITKTQAETSAIAAEEALTDQKLFTEQAQILDTVNGNAVVGVIGVQKALTTQQTAKLVKEEDLIDEQIFNSQAQRLDTVNGQSVVGVLGAEIALKNAQASKIAEDELVSEATKFNLQAQRLDTVDGVAVDGVIGLEKLQITAQTAKTNAETLLVGKQEDLVDEQIFGQQAQRLDTVDGGAVTGVIGSEIALNVARASKLAKDETLVDEQIFSQQAQRLDTVDGGAVQGVIALQKAKLTADTSLVGKQEDLVDQQILTETANTTNPTGGISKAQYDKLTSEKDLLTQKTYTEEAQVNDTYGVGATPVDADSIIGKQKALYQKQTDGFDRDAEVKAAKVVTDLWSISKSVDTSYILPDVASIENPSGTLNTTLKDLLTKASLSVTNP